MRKLVAALVIAFSLCVPALSFAQLTPSGSGLTKTGDQAYGKQAPADLDAAYYIGTYIIKPVLGFTAVIFLVLTVYAGFLWMTAAGNDKQIGTAKQILVAAVVGVVIMASAYVITNTVISALSSNAVSSGPGGGGSADGGGSDNVDDFIDDFLDDELAPGEPGNPS